MSAKHAGIIFGFLDTLKKGADGAAGRIFVMEPVKIEDPALYRDYVDSSRSMHDCFFTFSRMEGKITEIYQTKSPRSASDGDDELNPLVMN